MNQMVQFDGAAVAVRRHASQATQIEQSRAIAEVQAAVVVAQQRHRDKAAAMAEMREVCRIPELAERAFFRFSRAGSPVNGETIHLARELARCWGNITSGIAELSRDDIRGQSEMMAFAWDLQTNDRQQTTFIVPHVRDSKTGAKPLTDMRDIYENNANMGARRLREMIFAVLPVWFKEEAAAICHQTLEDGGGKPLVSRVTDCLAAFESIGVTRQQIERKISRPVEGMTAEDVAAMGVIFKSIKRGEVTKEEEFPREREAQDGTRLDQFEATVAAATESAATAREPDWTDELLAAFQRAGDEHALKASVSNAAIKAKLARLKADDPERAAALSSAYEQRMADFRVPE